MTVSFSISTSKQDYVILACAVINAVASSLADAGGVYNSVSIAAAVVAGLNAFININRTSQSTATV